MNAEVTEQLTRDSISGLLVTPETGPSDELSDTDQRRTPHWLTDGGVELWPLDENWQQPWCGKCHNISVGGMGLSSDHYFEPGSVVGINLHLADSRLQGKAAVRYCQKVRNQFMTGLEFIF